MKSAEHKVIGNYGNPGAVAEWETGWEASSLRSLIGEMVAAEVGTENYAMRKACNLAAIKASKGAEIAVGLDEEGWMYFAEVAR